MSQERWDVEVLFLNGPLSMRASLWFQGPLVRIGKRAGADGMNLQSYQGVATVHATIQVPILVAMDVPGLLFLLQK